MEGTIILATAMMLQAIKQQFLSLILKPGSIPSRLSVQIKTQTGQTGSLQRLISGMDIIC